MKLWQFIKQQYDFVIRTAGTPLANRLMLLYSALESIIIPIPVDPLLVAVVLAKPNQWRRIAFTCTIASVIGGAGGPGTGVCDPGDDFAVLVLPVDSWTSTRTRREHITKIIYLAERLPAADKPMDTAVGVGSTPGSRGLRRGLTRPLVQQRELRDDASSGPGRDETISTTRCSPCSKRHLVQRDCLQDPSAAASYDCKGRLVQRLTACSRSSPCQRSCQAPYINGAGHGRSQRSRIVCCRI